MIWLMPLISGLGTWAATGDFKKGLLSAALGAGIGGIAGAMGNAAGGAASVGTDLATKVGAEAITKGAQTGIQATTAGAGSLGSGIASMAPQGIQAVGKAAQVAGAQGGNGQVMQAGLDFLKRKPVTSGLLLSALTSSAMAPEMETPESKKGEPFSDQYQTTDRSTLPFTGGPPPGPSSYAHGDSFSPDNPYRYAQYEREKMFFDRPGLERGPGGGIPALPGPAQGGGNRGRDGGDRLIDMINERIRDNGYAAGGLLKGPGDGQSDNIEAAGPEGRVLLSEGEFVIPADVVAALGAGSTDAGAKRLYSAMDKIRTQSYGSAKQAKRPGRVSL